MLTFARFGRTRRTSWTLEAEMARRRGQIWQRTKNLASKDRAREKAKAVVQEVKRERRRQERAAMAMAAAADDRVAMAAAAADAVLAVVVNGQPFSVEVFDLQEVDGDVVAVLAISDANGNPAPFSNPLIVRNHPVEVPDETFYEALDEEGQTMMLMNMVEDPVEAFRQVVEQTLAIVLS